MKIPNDVTRQVPYQFGNLCYTSIKYQITSYIVLKLHGLPSCDNMKSNNSNYFFLDKKLINTISYDNKKIRSFGIPEIKLLV